MFWLALLLVVGCLVLVGIAVRSDRARLAHSSRFASRSAVDLRDIFDRHFAGSGMLFDDFLQTWRRIAQIVELDPARMRPEDELAQLRPKVPLGWGETAHDDLDDLIIEAEKDKNRIIDPQNVRSVGDLLRAIC